MRRHNLSLYLREMDRLNPSVLLVGEAPGYRGTGVTGVPFADSRLLTAGLPTLSMFGKAHGYRLPTAALHPQHEQTSTIVWQAFTSHRFVPLLWAAFPFHPYGERGRESNRAPTLAELELGESFIQRLLEGWDIKRLVAVGRVAERTLRRLGFDAEHIRHPARGGKRQFEQGIAELASDAVAIHAL